MGTSDKKLERVMVTFSYGAGFDGATSMKMLVESTASATPPHAVADIIKAPRIKSFNRILFILYHLLAPKA